MGGRVFESGDGWGASQEVWFLFLIPPKFLELCVFSCIFVLYLQYNGAVIHSL